MVAKQFTKGEQKRKMKTPKKDITNHVIGNFTVISYADEGKWKVKCICGLVFNIKKGSLVRSKSCGCKTKKHRRILHNQSRTVTYVVWNNIKSRVLNKHHPRYVRYKEKGITICEKWLNFEGFLEDMGKKPSENHIFSRLDSSKGYYKNNCNWINKKK